MKAIQQPDGVVENPCVIVHNVLEIRDCISFALSPARIVPGQLRERQSVPYDKALILYYLAQGALGAGPNVSYFYILDLETGAVAPLKQAAGQEAEFSGLSKARLSPDGSKVLYVYRYLVGEEPEFRLAVRDVEGGAENVLLASADPLGFQTELGLGLDWAANDTLYVATSPSSGLLITLGTD